ncbi:hypothetical protein NP233_g972 [Leucocoprinus birnbaumii]|uniref:Uncharacterized protein n=1 Tax=Leucocoprinus birnbaumii TaxID=56174 RepID=A0AAD5W4U2_9AGAR|nr:hypothetical protein NP233_g972 [Leucocoprinus birnbaumii]
MRFSTGLIALFSVIPLAAATGYGNGNSSGGNCKNNEFYWQAKSCCLPTGGNPRPPSPPKGVTCPPSGYDWNNDKGCCVPHYPPPPSGPPPQCGNGYSWYSALYHCHPNPGPSHTTTTTHKPSPTPTHTKPTYPTGYGNGGYGNGGSGGYGNNGGSNGGYGNNGGSNGGYGNNGGNNGGYGNNGGNNGGYGNNGGSHSGSGGYNSGWDPSWLSRLAFSFHHLAHFFAVFVTFYMMIRPILVLCALAWFLLAGFWFQSLTLTLALPLEAPDYSRNTFPWKKGSRHSLDSSLIARAPQILTASDLGHREVGTRDRQRYEDTYQRMDKCYQGLLASSLDLCRLPIDQLDGFFVDASQANLSDLLPALEDVLSDGLKLYQSNLLCIRTNLDSLGREKGLAYYDHDSELETLIKNVINVHKDTLSYLDELVYRIPGVGPVVGPIVYDIKCLVDKVLDSVENISDALVNTLRPILKLCSLDTLKVACKSGLSLLGICI